MTSKMNLQDFVPAKSTLILGGKNVVFTRLDFNDWAKLYEWVALEKESSRSKRRDSIIEESKKLEDVDPIALLKHLDDPPSEDEQAQSLGTLEGLAQMALWSLRHEYPDITNTEVKSLLTIDDTIPVVVACTGVAPPKEDEKKTTPEKEPTTTTAP